MDRAYEVIRVDDELEFHFPDRMGGIIVRVPVTRWIEAREKMTCPECNLESFQVDRAVYWECPFCLFRDVPRIWRWAQEGEV